VAGARLLLRGRASFGRRGLLREGGLAAETRARQAVRPRRGPTPRCAALCGWARMREGRVRMGFLSSEVRGEIDRRG
jgi:hypothetical protein